MPSQGFIDVTYMSSKPDGLRLSRGNKVETSALLPRTPSLVAFDGHVLPGHAVHPSCIERMAAHG
jgi:hypothetical protein